MKTIKASEFKAICLKLIDEVAETGQTLVITKNGQTVAQLGPVVANPPALVGVHRGKLRILGDILAPIDEKWEASR